MTLVELLVVLGLMALIVVFMTNGMGALRTFMPLADRIGGQDEVTAVRDHLRQTVSEAFGKLLLRQRVRFAGTADAVRLLAPSDPLFEVGGLYRIGIAAAEQPRGQLALVETRSLDREDRTETAAPIVLLDRIDSVAFRFRAHGQSDFSDTVSDGDPLPDLVEIIVRFPPGDPRRWQPLLIDLPNISK